MVDIPSGCERFIQYWGITAGSERSELAQKFINFMISPEALAKDYEEFGMVPMLERDVIEPKLTDGYYDNPAIEKYKTLYDKSWMVSVSDEQINLIDGYYTELMGE